MQINLAGTDITLLAQKAIFIQEECILVIADLHLGKAMHFRKSGIFMPVESGAKDYETLNRLILQHNPKQVYFLGDLFHSQHNSEWKQFVQFIETYPHISFTLIKGNHDILALSFYEALNIHIIHDTFQYNNLLFSHEPMEQVPTGKINIAGHIHPGCMLKGLAKQYLRLPCFHLKNNIFILPAFGYLTGLQMMDQKNASIFTILNDEIIML